jgi:hypothetical protein
VTTSATLVAIVITRYCLGARHLSAMLVSQRLTIAGAVAIELRRLLVVAAVKPITIIVATKVAGDSFKTSIGATELAMLAITEAVTVGA